MQAKPLIHIPVNSGNSIEDQPEPIRNVPQQDYSLLVGSSTPFQPMIASTTTKYSSHYRASSRPDLVRPSSAPSRPKWQSTAITTAATPQFTYLPNQLTTPAPPRPEAVVQQDDSHSIALILKTLQETNQLPKTLTADNVDNSIKTLLEFLNNLKEKAPKHEPLTPTHTHTKVVEEEERYDDYDDLPNMHVDEQLGANSGTPGVDYPNLFSIPETAFNCKEQRYKGFFGDPETRCQVWHYCDLNGGQASFLCPNGTIFSQESTIIN